jgi:Phospholipid methyltransferase
MTKTEGPDRNGRIFERQWLHAVSLVALLGACAWAAQLPNVRQGSLWGLTAIHWYWIAIFTAVLHQVYVWLCWRAELNGKRLTRVLGSHAFQAFAVGFALIGLSRVLSVFVLALANQDSLTLNPLWMKVAACAALLPALYLFYSVKRYFSFKRAFGADHFDPAYRTMPFERRGIFRYSSNGMYVFGFLLLWVPGLWWNSSAALAVALFNHVYIWVHYFATELPDISRIYGGMRSSDGVG